MIALLRRYFAYPHLPGGEATARARTFHRVAFGILVIAPLFLLLLAAIEPSAAPRRFLSAGLVAALDLLLIEANRRGYTRLASRLLIIGLVAIAARSALTAGGFEPPFGFFMVVFVALGGLLFTARGVILCAIFLGLLSMALVWLGAAGLLPHRELTFTPLTTWLYAMLSMAISVMVYREVSGTLKDSLRRAEADLGARRRAQGRLQLALATGKLGVWVLDLSNRSFHADATLFDMYALPYNPDFLMSYEVWLGRVHPEDRSALEQTLGDLSAGVKQVQAEFRIVRPDGSVRHIQGEAALEQEPDGGMSTVVGMNRDITDRRRAEREQKRILHHLGERVKELNLLHSTARLMQQRRPSDREVLEQLVAWIPAAWQYPECCEARLRFPDMVFETSGWRETAWVQSIEFAIGDGVGRIDVAYLEARPTEAEGPFLTEERALLESLAEMLVGYVELRKHRTELEALVETRTREMREARDEAERASGAKGEFLATMSHEIRTPMNAILGYSQLLRRDPTLGKSHHDKLDAILSSGDHLLTLINNVLDMSRIDAGKTSLVIAPFNLHALLNELRDMFAELIAAKRLTLAFDGVYALPRVVNADAGRVRQVLINLVSNALKFTERGGITIRAFCETGTQGHRVTIAVKDSGAGIGREHLDRVFEVFEQSAVGVGAGGAGLGLPIARELARLMGGDLTVSSVEGSGSTFTFSFDAGIADAMIAPRADHVVRIKPGQRRPKVLIVDDQPDNLTIADELLRSVGFETALATRGEEALAVHEEWHPDLILMDVRMPGMGGIEAIRRLRTSGSRTLAVAFTASGLDAMASEARAAGADDVVLKPCKDAQLLEVIGRLLNLEYEYENAPAGVLPGSVAPAASAAPLQRLARSVPPALLDELLTVAVQARTAQLEQLAGDVARHDPAAADHIRTLAREFRLDELIGALRAIPDA